MSAARVDRGATALRAEVDRSIFVALPSSAMPAPPTAEPQRTTRTVTFLFTDIEGSTALWEEDGARMSPALAAHDALARAAVARNRGTLVKTTGDGIYAVFDDALDALGATLDLNRALADPAATCGVTLRARCGLHAGVVEHRDNDFFGRAVNRAARIMGTAHGGQILLSRAVADAIHRRLPSAIALRDLGIVHLRDLASPEQVFQVDVPDLRREFPPLRSLAATPNNLPQQLTPLFGRERELAEVQDQLARVRLLTLLGVGGLGKTRIALQAGADTLDDYPDGVWVVELAPLSDERLVPQAVASVLGIREESGRALADTLARHVADRRMLLVLDNCEHVLPACARLTRHLLQAGPLLRVLATSREPLRIDGETTYPLPTLATPEPATAPDPAALLEFASVRLFADRAAAAQPAFRVTRQNAGTVASVCRQLDGIPLALELAAARVRSVPVETIAARLQDRLRLLTTGYQTSLPRQRTLRASIDWSFELLPPPERMLFRRLAVFAGSWSLAAAEAVCGGNGIDGANVLDLLTQLVDKSLVSLDPETGRYRMLETIRQYAREKLADAGEEGAMRTRHLAHYTAFAFEAGPKLHGPEQKSWLAALDVDHENFLLAHAWCDHAEGGASMGLRLVRGLQIFWLKRGLLPLGYRIAKEALARPGTRQLPADRGPALYIAANLGYYAGAQAEALRNLEESLALGRQLEAGAAVAQALALLGSIKHEQGDLAAAQAHLTESIALTRQYPDPTRLATALIALAEIHRAEGNLDAALPLYEESLALVRAAADHGNVAIILINLSLVAIARSDRTRARAHLSEALAIARELDAKYLAANVLSACPSLAVLSGEWQRGAWFQGAAERQLTEAGLRLEPTDEAFFAPRVGQLRAALGEHAYAEALAAGRAQSYDEATAEAQAWLGG